MSQLHPDFAEIQQRLSGMGYYAGEVDSEWGPQTMVGIRRVLALVEQARGIQPPAAPTIAPPPMPSGYGWLQNIGTLPRHMTFALSLLGTVETVGAGNNASIMRWRDELRAAGIDVSGYNADSVPWCGLFMAYVMLKADRQPIAAPLWALNWGKFGEDGGQPEFGDVLTFTRPGGGGHVALYVAEDAQGFYHILGGNQSDRVNIMRIAKTRMRACRQVAYRQKPASVKPYVVATGGQISRNEG